MKNPFTRLRAVLAQISDKRFWQKVGQKAKEPVFGAADLDALKDPYYAKVANRYGLLQIVLFIVLFFFVIFSVFGNIESITYGNFLYFVKDFEASAGQPQEGAMLYYNADTAQSFLPYRTGLAVVGNKTLTLFTASGRKTLGRSVEMTNPRAVVSDKTVLAYDLGGTHVLLCNSFATLWEKTYDYAVTDAALSASGSFAVVTGHQTYRCAVDLYTDSYSLTGRYLKNAYLTDLALNASGNRLAMVGLEPVGDDVQLSARIWMYESGTEKALLDLTLENELPLACTFNADGDLLVLCREELLIFNAAGRELDSIALGGYGESVRFSLGADGIVLLCKSTAPASGMHEEYRVIVLDSEGNLVRDEQIAGDVSDVARSGQGVYLLQRNAVIRLDLRTGQTQTHALSAPALGLVAADGRSVYLCRSEAALLVRF